jgi:hypothetical protein
MARGSLAPSPILAIAQGVMRAGVDERDRARAAAERAELAQAPIRERRRQQELARTELLGLGDESDLHDDAFDETRDYGADLEEIRRMRRREDAYLRTVPTASRAQARALLSLPANVATPRPKPQPRRVYDSTRGGYFDEDSGSFHALPNLPKRIGTGATTGPRERIVTTDRGVFKLNEATNTLTPVTHADSSVAQPRPGGSTSAIDLAIAERLRGRGRADSTATPARAPLTEDQKRRARNDARYRQFLRDEKGYTDADWAAAPAAPPTR